jgi:hypothetical protein
VKQKLLVLSGAADPTALRSQGRYKLVVEEALRRGYEAPQVVAWIGQDSAGGGSMNLTTASSQLAKLIKELESKGSSYDVVAFSWGCSVYLNTLSQMDAPEHLRNTVLWGIDEYWRMSEYFLTEESTRALQEMFRDAGTTISSDFFTHQVSNEVLLKNYPHSNPIRIGFGENDSESPPAFAAYIESFVSKHNITYRIVPGVGHFVANRDREYIDCLFGG